MFDIETYRILIPFLVLFSFFAVSWRSRTVWNPASITILWWGACLWLSTFSLTGIFIPSEKTILCTLIFLAGLTVGPWLVRRPPPNDAPFILKPVNDEKFVQKFEKIFPWLFWITAAMVIPALIRAMIGLATIPSYIFKAKAFGTPDEPGLIFKSNLLQSIYFALSSPLLLALLVFGMALFLMTGRKREIVAGVTLNVCDGVMRLGRVNIYLVCLFVALGTAMMFGLRKSNGEFVRAVFKRIGAVTVVAGLLLVLILQIGYARQGTRTAELVDDFKVYGIEYHTIGFALFDSKLKDPSSDLNQKVTYGRLAFGGFESLFTILIRRFDRDYNSPALENAVKMSAYTVIGYDLINEKQIPKAFNSYYTILYTLYSDGRYLGLLIGGVALGALLAGFFAAWRLAGTIEPLVWIFFLLSVTIFGIFVSTLEIMRTWQMVMGLIALHYWANRKPTALQT